MFLFLVTLPSINLLILTVEPERRLQNRHINPQTGMGSAMSNILHEPSGMIPHVQSQTGRSERTLPLPSSLGTNLSGMPSFPSLPAPWGPDRVPRFAQESFQQTVGPQSMEIYYDVKHESSGVLSVTSGLPASASDSDLAGDSMASPAAKMSARELQRLKIKMTSLQGQVEELRRQLDLVQQHAIVKDSQYAQIIEQSAKRELQGLHESKKWRHDREQWAEEREFLQETIADLNAKLNELRGYVRSASGGTAEQSSRRTSLVASQSTTLTSSAEASSALSSPFSDEPRLASLKREGDRIAEQGARLVEVGKSIQRQLDELREELS